MPDLLEVATYSEDTGTYTTIKALEDSATIQAVRASTQVKRGQRQQSTGKSQRRYGGSVIAGETVENGEFTRKLLVSGATVDAAIASLEAMFAVLESPRTDLYLAWQPDGATYKTLYEIRGPATWQPEHDWAQLTMAGSIVVTVTIPVAPLATTDSVTDLSASFPTTLPAVYSPATAVPGKAPCLATLELRASGGTDPPIWALVGWTKRPGSPLSGSVAPFGLIEAETMAGLSTWAAIGTDANYSGSNGVRATTSGAGSASGYVVVDPSVMQPDDFTAGTIDIEVWARVELAYTVVSPKITLTLEPNAGSSFGAVQYAAEYGTAGKSISVPVSGTRFRFVKLGTVTMPVDQALKWNVKLAGSWAGGSSGSFGVDYLILVPARQRAVSRCGVPKDGNYPEFIPGTGDTTKQIRADLSGRIASGTGGKAPHTGLGGAPFELPPGPVDFVIKLSSMVADDPDPPLSTLSEQKTHGLTSGLIRCRPRWFYARDA